MRLFQGMRAGARLPALQALVAGAALAAGVSLLPLYTQFVAGRIALLVVVTLSLNLLIGVAGLLSLASAAFMGIGAFGVTILTINTDIPLPVSIAISVAVAWALGWVIGTLAMRLAHFYLALTTLGFLIAFQTVVTYGGTLVGEGYGLVAPPPELFGQTLSIDAVVAAAMFLAGLSVVLVASMLRSRTGRAWRTMKADTIAAQLAGMNLLRMRTSAFALSAALAALAGTVYAFLLQAVSPAGFNIHQMINQLVYAIVGGLGSVWGSVLGPLVLEAIPELMRGLDEHRPLLFGGVLLLVLVLAPKGLAGMLAAAGGRVAAFARRRWPALEAHAERRRAERTKAWREAAVDASALRRRKDVALDRAATAVAFQDVSVHYGGLVAVDRLDFTVASGALHGVIGPNGAGKTTMLNALSGLVRVQSGTILVGGESIRSAAGGVAPHGLAKRGIARTFQRPLIVPELDAVENVMVGLHAQMRSGIVTGALRPAFVRREERAARSLALEALERVSFGADVTAPVSLLPFGEVRRLEIARALVSRPRLLLLDEPTSGLEMDAAVAILSRLRTLMGDSDHSMTVVIVEHNVPLLFSHCDSVTAMVEGRAVVTGTPSEVRADAAVQASYLGEQVDIEKPADVAGGGKEGA